MPRCARAKLAFPVTCSAIPAVISWPMTGRYQSHSRLVWARVYTQLSPKRFKNFWGLIPHNRNPGSGPGRYRAGITALLEVGAECCGSSMAAALILESRKRMHP